MLGPSGCGKTTTLRMIGGLEEVTSRARSGISGKDVTDLPPSQRDTSMMFQSFALFPHRNGHAERRVQPQDAGRVEGGTRHAGHRKWSRWLGLGALADRKPHDLSPVASSSASPWRVL